MNPIVGRYRDCHGREAWCCSRPGDSIRIEYDDGSFTVMSRRAFQQWGFEPVAPSPQQEQTK